MSCMLLIVPLHVPFDRCHKCTFSDHLYNNLERKASIRTHFYCSLVCYKSINSEQGHILKWHLL